MTWTKSDSAAARVEGWCVTDTLGYGIFEIEALRDGGFRNDAQAIGYVQEQALAGSELHQRAFGIVASLAFDPFETPNSCTISGYC